MRKPFRHAPATEKQHEELRRLARWPGLPQPESSAYVEKRIKDGMDVNEAYGLIGTYGARIQAMKEAGPVVAMANEMKRLNEEGG